MKIKDEWTTLRQLAKSCKNTDTRFIERELADDCVYEPKCVLTPVERK